MISDWHVQSTEKQIKKIKEKEINFIYKNDFELTVPVPTTSAWL